MSVLVVIVAAIVAQFLMILDSFCDCVLEGKYLALRQLPMRAALAAFRIVHCKSRVRRTFFRSLSTAVAAIHLTDPTLRAALAPSPYPGLQVSEAKHGDSSTQGIQLVST